MKVVIKNLDHDLDPDWIRNQQQPGFGTGFGESDPKHCYIGTLHLLGEQFPMCPTPTCRRCETVVRGGGAEERTAGRAFILRGRPARHHPATEPGRSQAHQNLSRLFVLINRLLVTLLVWRVRRGLVGCCVA
jgi:hypothetical protein